MYQERLADKGFEGPFEVVPSTVRFAARRAAQARLHVIGEDNAGGGVEGGAHRGDLAQDLRAVTVGVDHPAHGLKVPCSPSESLLDVWPVGVWVRVDRVCCVVVGNSRITHRGRV